eukprot:3903245-Pyramimonas_sp.AAC.1
MICATTPSLPLSGIRMCRASEVSPDLPPQCTTIDGGRIVRSALPAMSSCAAKSCCIGGLGLPVR